MIGIILIICVIGLFFLIINCFTSKIFPFKIFKCGDCKERITLYDNLGSVHRWFEKGYCDKCETKHTFIWVKQQMKLIKEGKRGIPEI